MSKLKKLQAAVRLLRVRHNILEDTTASHFRELHADVQKMRELQQVLAGSMVTLTSRLDALEWNQRNPVGSEVSFTHRHGGAEQRGVTNAKAYNGQTGAMVSVRLTPRDGSSNSNPIYYQVELDRITCVGDTPSTKEREATAEEGAAIDREVREVEFRKALSDAREVLRSWWCQYVVEVGSAGVIPMAEFYKLPVVKKIGDLLRRDGAR